MVVSELLVGEVNLNLMSKQEIESYLRDRYGEHAKARTNSHSAKRQKSDRFGGNEISPNWVRCIP
jgi:hypothetical protein